MDFIWILICLIAFYSVFFGMVGKYHKELHQKDNTQSDQPLAQEPT